MPYSHRGTKIHHHKSNGTKQLNFAKGKHKKIEGYICHHLLPSKSICNPKKLVFDALVNLA